MIDALPCYIDSGKSNATIRGCVQSRSFMKRTYSSSLTVRVGPISVESGVGARDNSACVSGVPSCAAENPFAPAAGFMEFGVCCAGIVLRC